MAWETVIIGYSLKDFTSSDIIPIGAIYVKSRQRASIWSADTGHVYKYETIYTYQVPVYKKKNIKRTL